ncbi:hypothetical protein ACFC06_26675 [Nocardia sp. NPDC056064]|uniref:hypothetical protein n=1 Tax=Nocardia sp. NPDC056064 TaxID=3345701 RepID=UPI0035DD08F6
MTIHRPGRPTDLPKAEILWARWALIAAVRAEGAAEDNYSGHWIDADGLHWDDSGCTWWIFSRMGAGRFVLYGEDETSQVKWHQPPIDMLAGAPDWLPHEELRDRIEGYEVGSVYWYENGVWARVPYPDDLRDDGLDCGMAALADRNKVIRALIPHLTEPTDGPSVDNLLADAEDYRLDAQLLLDRLRSETRFDPPPDRAAAARTLAAAGIIAEHSTASKPQA